MTAAPLDEEAARRILWFFTKNGCRPGHVAMATPLSMLFVRSPWEAAHYRRGLDYGVAKGWFKDLQSTVELTKEGYNHSAIGELATLK